MVADMRDFYEVIDGKLLLRNYMLGREIKANIPIKVNGPALTDCIAKDFEYDFVFALFCDSLPQEVAG